MGKPAYQGEKPGLANSMPKTDLPRKRFEKMTTTEPQDGQKTVLHAEDEAVIATAERRALQKQKFHVLAAPSAEKAIEMVNNDEHIDLILMDINLEEGMDGTQAAEVILKNYDIPVVFLFSHTEEKVVEIHQTEQCKKGEIEYEDAGR